MRGRNFALQSLLLVLLATSLLAYGATDCKAVYKDPTAIATFESIGISWEPEDYPDEVDTVQVEYRKTSGGDWRDAMPLWLDPRHGGYPNYPDTDDKNEYRGSIVGLDPGTEYVIKLIHPDVTDSLTISTWSETLPISETVYLPWFSDTTLVINEGGDSSGYKLYTFDPDIGRALIDCYDYDTDENPDWSCVHVRACSVIIRGLTLHGGKHGVEIESFTSLQDSINDVVIEECDISKWGRHEASDGTSIYPVDSEVGQQMDAAVNSVDYVPGNLIGSRFIIQRNRMHNPRWDSCYWDEYPLVLEGHPYGPTAVALRNSGGNHVIRYNEIYSDSSHYLFDGLTGGSNRSVDGFPGHNSDIYGNSISNVWDDAIEAEGGNANVRIWGNFTNNIRTSYGLAPVATGPLYLFRNVSGLSYSEPSSGSGDTGVFVKLGHKRTDHYGDGALFIYHNTMLQPAGAGPGESGGFGHGHGIANRSMSNGGIYNIVARNNILMTPASDDWSIYTVADPDSAPYSLKNAYSNIVHNAAVYRADTLYVDGDMFPGIADFDGGVFNPYDESGTEGVFYVAGADTLALDNGYTLPNFNDSYDGSGPDIGAHERGDDAMEFGTGAYLTPDPDIPYFADDFEILLRNGFDGYTGTDDAGVTSGNVSYLAGADTLSLVKGTYNDRKSNQILFRFNIADLEIPTHADLDDATFGFYDTATGSFTVMEYDIYPMEHDWNEDYVCWSNYDDGLGWTIINETGSTAAATYYGWTGGGYPIEIGITSLVESWRSTPAEADYGFMLIEQDCTSRYIYMSEAAQQNVRPYLALTISFDDSTVCKRVVPGNDDLPTVGLALNIEETPVVFTSGLNGNYPNPFNPVTKISFTVGHDELRQSGSANVALEIFDVSGRRVARLHRGQLPAGDYSYSWRGRTDSGVSVSSGMYFSRLQIEDRVFTQKMIMLK
ncbi:MAG: DNRLRE domain-containing protein [bacterium]|nr:DNRLRE domain-containing protein [bacterium]